jgi:hypothetical protein
LAVDAGEIDMLFQMPGAIPLRQNHRRSTRGSDDSVSLIE